MKRVTRYAMRMYRPDIGRWMSRDSLYELGRVPKLPLHPPMWAPFDIQQTGDISLDEGLQNLYHFVMNNPIDLKLPGVSPYTTIPSSLSAKLRLGGRSTLRIFGRYTQIAMVAYGLALATIEAHCSGHCCGIRQYDPSVGNIYDQMYRYLDDMFRDSRGETYGVGL